MAVAAAAVVGVAVVGVKLARERLSRRGDQPSRAYRLQRGEFVPDGLRRIARGQIDGARDGLDGASKRKLGAAVQDARKRLKRLRTTLRLSRTALEGDTYRLESAAFRDAGRRLSSARDAEVLLETLDGLHARFAGELSEDATAGLRAQLDEEHERALSSLRDDEDSLSAVLAELAEARLRTAGWEFEDDGFDALAPGLQRIYRRGRRRMRAAAAEPTTENLHEWRKRVKDLWYAAQMLRPAGPKRMKKLARRAHDLSDLLGDDHDLAILAKYAEAHPRLFESDAGLRALRSLIDRRRRALQKKAFRLGERLYEAPPKRFVRCVAKGWRKRAGKSLAPVAGD